MHPMTSAEINAIFDILVETCGAAPETRYAFVQSIERQLSTSAPESTELAHFAFGGYLGFGGKVVFGDDRITVTAIDENPRVRAVIARANAALARALDVSGRGGS